MVVLNTSHMAVREKVIATCFTLGVALISMKLYHNREATYTAGKNTKIASVPTFSIVYRYIQASTILCTLGGCLFHDSVFLDMHDSTFVFYIGLTIAALGIGLFVHAKLTLGINYSPCFDSYLPLSITKVGVYRHIRHPLYLSNLILLLGGACKSRS